MSKENPKTILIAEIPEGITIYLCGDKENRGCGLDGKLVALTCHSCYYRAGIFGRNCIRQDLPIIYNPNLHLW